MIPRLAVIRIRARRGRNIRFWILLTVLWILLAPFAILALPLFLLYCLIGRVSLVRAVQTSREMVGGLAGTQVEFENGAHQLSLHIA